MRTSDTLSHLRALDWLKPDTPHIWSLGKNPECRKTAKDGSLKPASVPRMGTWGIARGGWCLTQTLKPEPGIGEGCSLSEILVPGAVLPPGETGGETAVPRRDSLTGG